MSKPMTLNVRIGGALGDFVATNVGDQGAYENVSEASPDPNEWASPRSRDPVNDA